MFFDDPTGAFARMRRALQPSGRVTFLVVAAFGVVVALHYAMRIGETHPADRRAPLVAMDA